MKRLGFLLFVILLFSCEKDKIKNSIIGKWRLAEIYYENSPGCPCWVQVSLVNADILEFTVMGKYKITKPPISSSVACPGRYQFINDTTVALKADCGGPNPAHGVIARYAQALNQLTVEYNIASVGLIKHKYVRN